MNKDMFMNPDYKPDENTIQNIEKLHDKGVSLSNVHLKHANMQNANLLHVDLSKSDLTRSDFSGASMYGANFEGANLFKTNFEGANLKNANLKNANLLGADFTNAKLNNINWGKNNKVINEIQADKFLKNGNLEKSIEKYKEAEDIYRTLKISLKNQTLGNDVGKVFIREMIVKRKQMAKFSPLRIASKIAHITTGYGEKVGNIFYTALGMIICCALLFGIAGVSYENATLGFFGDIEKFGGIIHVIGNLLYFSVVVFSTVGFGDIVPINAIGKSIVIVEGLLGTLLLSILIIALYKQLMDNG